MICRFPVFNFGVFVVVVVGRGEGSRWFVLCVSCGLFGSFFSSFFFLFFWGGLLLLLLLLLLLPLLLPKCFILIYDRFHFVKHQCNLFGEILLLLLLILLLIYCNKRNSIPNKETASEKK